MIAHVLGQQAGIFRIAAGDAGAEQDADGLALEEGGVLGKAGADRQSASASPRISRAQLPLVFGLYGSMFHGSSRAATVSDAP